MLATISLLPLLPRQDGSERGGTNRMAMIDLYWSFRSPYCYLALDRVLALQQRFRIKVVPRIVYPLAVRKPEFFADAPPEHLAYHALDATRTAAFLGLPYRRPLPDPIVQDMRTGAIAAEQPHIFRLTRLGAAAARQGLGLAFIDQVMRLLWDGSVDGWNEGSRLSDTIRRAGLDPAALEAEVEQDAEALDRLVAANQEALRHAGHWGVPTFVFEGEPFFGQDRLDQLEWRLRQKGLPLRE